MTRHGHEFSLLRNKRSTQSNDFAKEIIDHLSVPDLWRKAVRHILD